jgi:hypothetical protein
MAPCVSAQAHRRFRGILSRFRACDYIQGMDRILGLLTQFGTTNNHNIIADLHNLQIPSTREISVFTSRILATDLNTVIIPVSGVTAARMNSSFHCLTLATKSFLHSQTFNSQLTGSPPISFLITNLHGPKRKHLLQQQL